MHRFYGQGQGAGDNDPSPERDREASEPLEGGLEESRIDFEGDAPEAELSDIEAGHDRISELERRMESEEAEIRATAQQMEQARHSLNMNGSGSRRASEEN